MRFFFDIFAGNNSLDLNGENYNHIVRSQRKKQGDLIRLVNFKDFQIHTYEILQISKNKLFLKLISSQTAVAKTAKTHLAWAVVEPKTVAKTLPFLNELGIFKISFVYTHRSQKNFKLNLERLQTILINSSCQSGRLDLMNLEILDDLQSFVSAYPNASILDFAGEKLPNAQKDEQKNTPILVGPEGGFAKEDMQILKALPKYSLNHGLTLKSQTAIIALAARAIFV